MGLSGSKTDAFLIFDVIPIQLGVTKPDGFIVEQESVFWPEDTMDDAFEVLESAMVLTSIVPDHGFAGIHAMLYGSGFGVVPDTVYFGTETATIVSWSDTEIEVIVPEEVL